jgi:hypothetical protein
VIFLVLFALVSLVATDPFLTLIGLLTVPALGLMNRSFALQMQAQPGGSRSGSARCPPLRTSRSTGRSS